MEKFKKLSRAEMKNVRGGDGNAQCGSVCGADAVNPYPGGPWIGIDPTDPDYICAGSCPICLGANIAVGVGGTCWPITWY